MKNIEDDGTPFFDWVFIIKGCLVQMKGWTKEMAECIDTRQLKELYDEDFTAEDAMNICFG